MTTTGIEALDSTVHQTNVWLKAIMGRLGTEDRHRAYLALRTTKIAAHLGAQLPMLVRGIYYEDWHMAGTPTRDRHKEEFLAHIAAAFRRGPEIDPEQVVRAVLATLTENIDPGQVSKIIAVLPHELRELWPQPATPGNS